MIRYCRACEISELSGHPAFERALVGRVPPSEIVYLWDDGTVTDLPLPDSVPLFGSDAADWRELCARILVAEPAADSG